MPMPSTAPLPDCVKLSLEALLPDKPTMVISPINRGPNLGTDILYSGTVSAAVEGIIHGVPSFAISLDCFDDGPYYDVADGRQLEGSAQD